MNSQFQYFISLVCLLFFVSRGLALDNEKEVRNPFFPHLFDKRFIGHVGLRGFTEKPGRFLNINLGIYVLKLT